MLARLNTEKKGLHGTWEVLRSPWPPRSRLPCRGEYKAVNAVMSPAQRSILYGSMINYEGSMINYRTVGLTIASGLSVIVMMHSYRSIDGPAVLWTVALRAEVAGDFGWGQTVVMEGRPGV